MALKILLLSAYDADSHRRWYRGLQAQFPHYEWTVLSLPARYFSWRVRGNSLSWAFGQRQILQKHYDLLIATSMVDLSALRGFVPSLAALPTLVYFHENQFAYPDSGHTKNNVEPQILNLYTALSADVVVFNTEFNRDSFFQGAQRLLRKLPDHVPDGLLDLLHSCARVLPVPLENDCFDPVSGLETVWPEVDGKRPLRLLWAARWEYDKGPDLLLAILRALRARSVDFQLCLLGQSFRQVPEPLTTIRAEFARELVQYGHEPDLTRYRQWLASADMVLSTALHEFQGLAVLEAMAQGCSPVLPNRVSYPELAAGHFLYEVTSAGVDLELSVQAQVAVDRICALQQAQLPKPDVSHWGWSCWREPYRQLLEGLVS